MVSALYAVLAALLLIKFSFDVVRLRMQYRVSYGDGGFSELQSAIRIHGNAVEYIPIALLLLLLMEMDGAETWRISIKIRLPRSRRRLTHPLSVTCCPTWD